MDIIFLANVSVCQPFSPWIVAHFRRLQKKNHKKQLILCFSYPFSMFSTWKERGKRQLIRGTILRIWAKYALEMKCCDGVQKINWFSSCDNVWCRRCVFFRWTALAKNNKLWFWGLMKHSGMPMLSQALFYNGMAYYSPRQVFIQVALCIGDAHAYNCIVSENHLCPSSKSYKSLPPFYHTNTLRHSKW